MSGRRTIGLDGRTRRRASSTRGRSDMIATRPVATRTARCFPSSGTNGWRFQGAPPRRDRRGPDHPAPEPGASRTADAAGALRAATDIGRRAHGRDPDAVRPGRLYRSVVAYARLRETD